MFRSLRSSIIITSSSTGGKSRIASFQSIWQFPPIKDISPVQRRAQQLFYAQFFFNQPWARSFSSSSSSSLFKAWSSKFKNLRIRDQIKTGQLRSSADSSVAQNSLGRVLRKLKVDEATFIKRATYFREKMIPQNLSKKEKAKQEASIEKMARSAWVRSVTAQLLPNSSGCISFVRDYILREFLTPLDNLAPTDDKRVKKDKKINQFIGYIADDVCRHIQRLCGLEFGNPSATNLALDTPFAYKFMTAIAMVRSLPASLKSHGTFKEALHRIVFPWSPEELVNLLQQCDYGPVLAQIIPLGFNFTNCDHVDDIKDGYVMALKKRVLDCVADEFAKYNSLVEESRTGDKRSAFQVPSQTLFLVANALHSRGLGTKALLQTIPGAVDIFTQLTNALRECDPHKLDNTLLGSSPFVIRDCLQFVLLFRDHGSPEHVEALLLAYLRSSGDAQAVLENLSASYSTINLWRDEVNVTLDYSIKSIIEQHKKKREEEDAAQAEHLKKILEPLGITLPPLKKRVVSAKEQQSDNTKKLRYVMDNQPLIPRDKFDVVHRGARAPAEQDVAPTMQAIAPTGAGKSQAGSNLVYNKEKQKEFGEVFVIPMPNTPLELLKNVGKSLDSVRVLAKEDPGLASLYASAAYKYELASRCLYAYKAIQLGHSSEHVFEDLRNGGGDVAHEGIVPQIRTTSTNPQQLADHTELVLTTVVTMLKELLAKQAQNGKIPSLVLLFEEAGTFAAELVGLLRSNSKDRTGNLLDLLHRINARFFAALYVSTSNNINIAHIISAGGKDMVINFTDKLRPVTFSEIALLFTRDVPLVSEEIFESVEVDMHCGARFRFHEGTLNAFFEKAESLDESTREMLRMNETERKSMRAKLWRESLIDAEESWTKFFVLKLDSLPTAHKKMLHLLCLLGAMTRKEAAKYFMKVCGGTAEEAQLALDQLLDNGFCFVHEATRTFYNAEPLVQRVLCKEFIKGSENYKQSLQMLRKFNTGDVFKQFVALLVMIASEQPPLSSGSLTPARSPTLEILLGRKIANLPLLKDYELNISQFFRTRSSLEGDKFFSARDDLTYQLLRTTGVMEKTLEPDSSSNLANTLLLPIQTVKADVLATATKKQGCATSAKRALAVAMSCTLKDNWEKCFEDWHNLTAQNLVLPYGSLGSKNKLPGILRVMFMPNMHRLGNPREDIGSSLGSKQIYGSKQILDDLISGETCRGNSRFQRFEGIDNACIDMETDDITVIICKSEIENMIESIEDQELRHECLLTLQTFTSPKGHMAAQQPHGQKVE